MKVVLLTTRPSPRPAWLLEVRELLGVADRPDVEVSMVSAHRPRRPLPVTRHMLAAPARSVSGRATAVPVASAEPEVVASPAADPELLPWETAEATLGDDPGTDTVGGIASVPALGEPTEPVPTASLLDLPVYHPRRAAKAVSWRANKVRLMVKRHPGLGRVRNSTKLRKAQANLAPSSLPTSFALACLRAREIGALVDVADLVVALDANTHRAAWLLARRHPRPMVMVGTAAGKQAIESITASSPR